MISPEEAREIAREQYPKAPEALVDLLGITVSESPMQGCDGYCLSYKNRSIIRLNSHLTGVRRRFTLAHELGHLILGVPGVIDESFEEMLTSNSEEEHRVNELASALLLPETIVKVALPELPVDAAALQRLAKQANVSTLATAIRVCNLAPDIGLINATVVHFSNERIRWQWSQTLKRMPEKVANNLLSAAREESPNAFRHLCSNGVVIVASIIENPQFDSVTLFVQVLPEEQGLALSHHERRKSLEQGLFVDNLKRRQSVNGLLGAHKPRTKGMSFKEAVDHFWQRNEFKLRNTEMNSERGREYVELRIREWF